jgi:TonB-linked SusC/RagA family outer membrane protein
MKKYLIKIINIFFVVVAILLLFIPSTASFAQVQKKKSMAISNDSIKEDLKKIEVAYGKQSYNGVAASISTIYFNDMSKSIATTTGEALIGRLPGLTTRQLSGEPGTPLEVNIRGRNTYNDSSPLIIVDGFRGDYNSLSIYEIESVSILKDAAAVALYGQEGANGVLLVTTKRGVIGKTNIDFNFNYGVQQFSQTPDLLNASEYAILYNQALKNDGLPEKFDAKLDIPNYGKSGVYQFTHPDNNYMKMLMRTFEPVITSGINIYGGNETLRYMVTGGFIHTGGIYNFSDLNDGYSTQEKGDRFNLRSNLDIRIAKHLTSQIDLGVSFYNRNYPGASSSEILGAIYNTPPQEYPLINPDGSIGGSSVHQDNPYGLITSKGYQTSLTRNLDMTIRVKYDLGDEVKGLSFGLAGSAENYMQLWDNKTKKFAVYDIVSAPTSGENYDLSEFAYKQYNDDTDLAWATSAFSKQRLNFETNVAYERTFGDHKVNGLLMYHMDRYEPSGNYYKYSNAGFGLRGYYGFRDKYFAEFVAGYYGQEQYKKGHRFGFFPAGALAWVISKESFLKDNNFIDYLKIRASYGKVGGQAFNGTTVNDRIFFNQYYSRTTSSSFGTVGQTSYEGRAEGNMANPAISWDKSYKTDFSIEGTFLNHFNVMFDYFHDRRTNILTYNNKIPGSLGLSGGWGNGGEVKNVGYEATLGYLGKTGGLEYEVNTGIWYNHSKIIKKPDATIYEFGYRSEIGKPVGQNFGYVADGFWDNSTLSNMSAIPTFGNIQQGDTRYVNMNNDKVIDNNDMTAIGYSRLPEYTYSVTLNLKYKGFYFYCLGQGTRNGSEMLTGYFIPFSTQGNTFNYAKQSWSESTSSSARFPRLSTESNSNNNQNSTIWLYSSDYFKLRHLEIGYELPKKWIQSTHFNSIKISVHGQNLLTRASEIDFVDPETLCNFPSMKSYTLGINVLF